MGARVSDLDGLKLRLADWVPAEERYQQRLIPVDPESETISGDRPGLAAEPAFRTWAVRSWRGGEGITSWEREARQYRQSINVRPVSIRDGLELGARQIITPPNGGAGVFNDGRRFGYGLGRLWVVEDGDAYGWDLTNQDWDAAVSTGATTNNVTSLTDGDDTFMYSGHTNGVIRRWNSGGTAEWYATGTFTNPILRSFAGILYALNGEDLYEISKAGANTSTVKVQPNGSSAIYHADTPSCFGRMSTSDRGPIWIQRLDNGQTFVHLYDPNLDVHEVLGKIAVDFVFPYSILHTHGFTWVGLRYAPAHNQSGDAYIWFKRGAQEGFAGPIRSQTGVTASKPVLLAGVIGDDLIVDFDGAVWAYNLTDGAIYMLADHTSTATPEDAITFGKDVFVAPITSGGNTTAVERFNTVEYTTEDASIDLGKTDFDYPGMVKVLLDVTIITDPLPANTSIHAAVSADGGAFATIGSPSTTDGQTRHTFLASSSAGTTITGMEFEIRVIPDSTSSSATPTVREVSARATGGEHVLETVMVVDAGGDDGGLNSEEFIEQLRAKRVKVAGVVSWTDRFQLRETDAGSAVDVTVEDIVTPEVQDDHVEGRVRATVVVRGVSLI